VQRSSSDKDTRKETTYIAELVEHFIKTERLEVVRGDSCG